MVLLFSQQGSQAENIILFCVVFHVYRTMNFQFPPPLMGVRSKLPGGAYGRLRSLVTAPIELYSRGTPSDCFNTSGWECVLLRKSRVSSSGDLLLYHLTHMDHIKGEKEVGTYLSGNRENHSAARSSPAWRGG